MADGFFVPMDDYNRLLADSARLVSLLEGMEQVGWAQRWPYTGIHRMNITKRQSDECEPLFRLSPAALAVWTEARE